VLQVHRLAALGAVEIDDVEKTRARLRPAAGSRQGVLVVDRLRVEVSLGQPNGVAAEDVDRRIEVHRRGFPPA
jgi:hypothetical protein